jgi:16S rRNA (uracil1498-N3)-methyltransferase
MHRFFIPKNSLIDDTITISGDTARQIIKVLRLKVGENITILDNSGWEYQTTITSIHNDMVLGKVVGKTSGKGEPRIQITLCQALLKTDKFELVLQKGVELGVVRFVPFFSERCVAKMPSANKIERWQEIIKEAAEQSRRSLLPQLAQVIPFEEACEQAPMPSLILWEEEKTRGLRQVLKSKPFMESSEITIFVGPEGGFTLTEIEFARDQGIITLGLGKRILRAETAGLAVISAIMYEKGELGIIDGVG